MQKLFFSSVSLEVLEEVARDIVSSLGDNPPRRIILFYGEMGTGKTTLIKEICRQLGVAGNMSSPTYGLVNEYTTYDKKIIYHFDLCRVKNLEECLDFGMDEYLQSGNYCFIEWPDVAKQILPEDVLKVFIEGQGDLREIRLE